MIVLAIFMWVDDCDVHPYYNTLIHKIGNYTEFRRRAYLGISKNATMLLNAFVD